MPYDGSILIHCTCCQLRQRVKDRDGEPPKICPECVGHQGKLPAPRLARAESHELMLRERLYACSQSEKRANTIRDRSRETVKAALSSRGYLAVRIIRAARSQQGIQPLASDLDVQKWADRHLRGDFDYDEEYSHWSTSSIRARTRKPGASPGSGHD